MAFGKSLVGLKVKGPKNSFSLSTDGTKQDIHPQPYGINFF
jgi:hypothetical protein